MRIYLVKTEEEFTEFALTKYQEEIENTCAKSSSSRSNPNANTQKTFTSTKSLVSHTRLRDKLNQAQNDSYRKNKTVGVVNCREASSCLLKQ